MEIDKKHLGHIVKSKLHGDIIVSEENLQKLIDVNANVLIKPKKKAPKKFKGIKEDDSINTESAE